MRECKFCGQFHALSFTATERGGSLSQLQVSETQVVHGIEETQDTRLIRKKLQGLADIHIEDIKDILSFIGYFKRFVIKPLSFTFLAKDFDITHEMHPDLLITGALAFFAPAPCSIE